MADRINVCFLILVGLIMLNGLTAYPTGAPEEACINMTPNHLGYEPSLYPPPFIVTVSSPKFTVGEPVSVTIKMDPGKTFRGFLLLARRADRGPEHNDRIGSFELVAGTQRVCDRGGLTHTREGYQPKSELTVEWSLPATDFTYNPISVQFRVTVVSNVATFWVDERSPVIYDFRLNPTTTLPPTTPRSYSTDITEGCGKTKGCYRNPPSCSEAACDIVVTWKRLNDRAVEFEMSADTDGWVALGLSDDKFMGDDDVMECMWNKSAVLVRVSRNDGKDTVKPSARAQTQLSRIDWSHSKGRIGCQFVRTLPFRARSDRNSDNNALSKFADHYLLLAKGSVAEDGGKERHSLEPGKYPYVSPSVVDLKDKDDITYTARYPLVKAHGCLMLIAWMMCASTAVLLSKYYKRMWPNDSLCGVEVWFAVHRALMIICLILTAIAFILIFLHVGGYSHMPDYPDKAHPPLGICVMILVILNPFITLFRCKPKSKYRPIFNWFHWLFGTVAYVLQLPAIFIGLNLHKAFVPPWATWIMTAFVLFHLIIELLLEIHGCLNARKQQRRDDDFERTKKTDFKGEYQGIKEEPVGHRFKKIVLSIYLVVVIILGVIMVIAVAAG